MEKSDKVLWDENKNIGFDFSSALDVFEPHELANLYSDYLSDVDFVVEEDKKLICLEYKNSNIENADNPRVFYQKLVEEKFWNKMAKKFYGTIAI